MRLAKLGVALVAAPTLAMLVGASPAAAQNATWNFTQVHVTAASQVAGKQGKGITVAVIDTWVEASHPDFGGRVLAGADCSSGVCQAGLAAPDGCSPHGTHVSGTIASASYGVAPQTTILPLRVLAGDTEDDCSASVAAVTAAITYATNAGVRVINLSLGNDQSNVPSTGLTAAVAKAAQAGVLVVFAAGNSSKSESSPPYGTNALVVAATGPSGALAEYSEYGSGVQLAAPGGDVGKGTTTCTQAACVVSTWSDGRFAALEGTSMAAPHVAGAAALLFAQDPTRTRQQVMTILEDTAHPLSGVGTSGTPGGLIDVNAALAPTAADEAAAAAQPSTAASQPTVLTPTTPAASTTTKAPVAAPTSAAKVSVAPTPGATSDAAVPSGSSSSPSDPASPITAAEPAEPPVLVADGSHGTQGLPAVAVTLGWLTVGASGAGWVYAFRRRAALAR